MAALLALKMRGSFPTCFSWGFCPPGGMVTSRLAHHMEAFCISVVLGKVGAWACQAASAVPVASSRCASAQGR